MVDRGGIIMPMYQREAMWINFEGTYPMAVKIAAGKINAVTGKPWDNCLSAKPQDYMVTPDQPWLDGFYVQEGVVRQFVAEPLGQDSTVEEIMTGESEWGGLQIIVYPMKAREYKSGSRAWSPFVSITASNHWKCVSTVSTFRLSAGGKLHQNIYNDDYGFAAWESECSRCFVHIVNSNAYQRITGEALPPTPITEAQYEQWGLPWFHHYGEGLKPLPGGYFDAVKKRKRVSSGNW